MKYTGIINGLEQTAVYSDESVQEIFLPLLRKLADLQKSSSKRVLLMIAAAPATGKSTIVSFLEYLAGTDPTIPKTISIGMDGFHRYQEYLQSHTLFRDGREICMADVKGTPETFDLELLTEALRRVSSGEVTGWPLYDRHTHNPKQNAISVDADIVILEGNYLLLDQPGWRELKEFADYTVRIVADRNTIFDRLVTRKMRTKSYEDAVEFVKKSDMYNVDLCLNQSLKADLTLFTPSEGEYLVIEN